MSSSRHEVSGWSEAEVVVPPPPVPLLPDEPLHAGRVVAATRVSTDRRKARFE
jgi:hypothetical protein